MLKRVSNQQQIYCFKVLPHRNACLRLSSPHSDSGQSLEYKIFPSDYRTSQEGGGHRTRQGRSLTVVQASQCHGSRPGGVRARGTGCRPPQRGCGLGWGESPWKSSWLEGGRWPHLPQPSSKYFLEGDLYGVCESTRIWTNYKEKLHLCRETWHLAS